ELAGRVQAANGIAAGIDDLLPGIMHRPALRVRDRGPDLTEDERRLEADHRAWWASEVGIAALIALGVPTRDRGPERLTIEVRHCGQLFDGVGATQDAEVELLLVIGAPVVMVPGIVGSHVAKLIGPGAAFIGDEP